MYILCLFLLGGIIIKEAKTNEQLINHLITKGVKVKNKKKALKVLERYSYYAIVNTYKDVFKVKGKYINGVTFEEIYALYEFDKNIKAIFLKYTLEIELIIKALLANTISEKYGVKNYLKTSNFDSKADLEEIKKLKNKINKAIKNNYGKHEAITHYKDKYGFIPPFVLVKVLTFGEISKYYGLLKQSDRQKISKYFKLSDKELRQMLLNITIVRNLCAHNGRLYTYQSKFKINFKNITRNYKNQAKAINLYAITKCMEVLLGSKSFDKLMKEFKKEVNKLTKKLKCIDINTILNTMGFDVNKI